MKEKTYIETESILSYLENKIKSEETFPIERRVLSEITKDIVLRMPKANVRPDIVSEWVPDMLELLTGEIVTLWYCRYCKKVGNHEKAYCPECGARMMNYRKNDNKIYNKIITKTRFITKSDSERIFFETVLKSGK